MALLDKFVRKEIEPQADLVSDLRAVSGSKKNSAFAVEYTVSRSLSEKDLALNAEAEERGESLPVKKHQKIVIVFNNKSEAVLAYDIHDHLDIGYRMLWGTDSEYAEFVDDAAKMSKGVDTNRHHVYSNHFSQNSSFVEYIDVIYTDYVLQKISELHIAYEEERVEERIVEDIPKSDANKIGFFNASLDDVEEHLSSIAERKEKALNKIGLTEAESDRVFVEDAQGLDDREDINKLLIAAADADNDTSLEDIRDRSNGFLWVDVLERIASSNEKGWLKLIDSETGAAIGTHSLYPSEIPERRQFEKQPSMYDDFALGEGDLQLGVGAEITPGDYLPERKDAEAVGSDVDDDDNNVDSIFDSITEGKGYDEDDNVDVDDSEDFYVDGGIFEDTEEGVEDNTEGDDNDFHDADAEASLDASYEESYNATLPEEDGDDEEVAASDEEEIVIELPESSSDWSWEEGEGEDIFAEPDAQKDDSEEHQSDDSAMDDYVSPDEIVITMPENEERDEGEAEEGISDEVHEEESHDEEEIEEEEPAEEKSFYVPLDNEFPSFFAAQEEEEEDVEGDEEEVEEGGEDIVEEDYEDDSVIVGSWDGESEDALYAERLRSETVEQDEASGNEESVWTTEDEEYNSHDDYEASSEYSDNVEHLEEETPSEDSDEAIEASESDEENISTEEASLTTDDYQVFDGDDDLFDEPEEESYLVDSPDSETQPGDNDDDSLTEEPSDNRDDLIEDEDTEEDIQTDDTEDGMGYEFEEFSVGDTDEDSQEEHEDDGDEILDGSDSTEDYAYDDERAETEYGVVESDAEGIVDSDFKDFYEHLEDFGGEEAAVTDSPVSDESDDYGYSESNSLPTFNDPEYDSSTTSISDESEEGDFDDYPAIDHIDADSFMREYNGSVAVNEEGYSEGGEDVLSKTESGITQDTIFASLGLDTNEFSTIFEDLIRDKQRADDKLSVIPMEIEQNQKDLEELQHQAIRDSEEIRTLNQRFEELKQQKIEIQEEMERLFPELDEKSAYAVKNQHKIKQKSIVLERLETEHDYYANAKATAEKLLHKVERSDPATAQSVTEVLEKIHSKESQSEQGGDDVNKEVERDQIEMLEGEGGGVIEAVRAENRLKFRGDFVDESDDVELIVDTADNTADNTDDEADNEEPASSGSFQKNE